MLIFSWNWPITASVTTLYSSSVVACVVLVLDCILRKIAMGFHSNFFEQVWNLLTAVSVSLLLQLSNLLGIGVTLTWSLLLTTTVHFSSCLIHAFQIIMKRACIALFWTFRIVLRRFFPFFLCDAISTLRQNFGEVLDILRVGTVSTALIWG